MFALVDGEVLGDSIGVGGVVIVPASGQFLQFDGVGTVAVHFVGAHVGEHCRRGVQVRGFQYVQCADGVDVEVFEGPGGSEVVAGLRGGVDDDGGAEGGEEGADGSAVADVEFVVAEIPVGIEEPLLVPAGVAAGSEEIGAHVVVDAVDGPSKAGEVGDHFGADEAGGAGDEKDIHLKVESGKLKVEMQHWRDHFSFFKFQVSDFKFQVYPSRQNFAARHCHFRRLDAINAFILFFDALA